MSLNDAVAYLGRLLDNESKAWRTALTRDAAICLRWLHSYPGETWQERWQASGAEDRGGQDWVELPLAWLEADRGAQPGDRNHLLSGLLALLCADVIRPGMRWMMTRNNYYLVRGLERRRDPHGIARVRAALSTRSVEPRLARETLTKIAIIMVSKAGVVADITVGDCLQLTHTQREIRAQKGKGVSLAYEVLRSMGQFPTDAPATLRVFTTGGQHSVDQMVDRYQIKCAPVRDLIVDYLRERQPAVDYTTLESIAGTLGRQFWRDLELHHPGIDSLRLEPHVAHAWKERLRTIVRRVKQDDGTMIEVHRPRLNCTAQLITVRAFYLDIAQWAAEDPSRWGGWAVPCPVSAADVSWGKEIKRRKARMDQRTRERLPALAALVTLVNERRKAAQDRLERLLSTPEGEVFTVGGHSFHRLALAHRRNGTWAQSLTGGPRRDFTFEEHEAFWTWATIEVLRHTGIRIEELMELSHHSITQYQLPSTGELVPLLQIAPSKSDEERLLLVSPELADVLSAIVCRVRDSSGTIPLVASYDTMERVWNAPMPLLFQRTFGGERRPLTRTSFRNLLVKALTGLGLTDSAGRPLDYRPHDFRRLFVTDAVLNGLPPHIAQVICGHKHITTTMGYKAVYPVEAIEAHRAFIARRRAVRPSEEYRTPSSEEWEAFLGHFERRKLSLGTCARAFGTGCQHEHACVRCSLLRPDPAQRARLAEIRDNLRDRISEAEREGWLGEIEGLKVSLAGAEAKLAQLDAQAAQARQAVDLGMPSFGEIAAHPTWGQTR
ncbi:tyrosine-type recombinase/integrase [Streptosporangium canum]|uniref:tyrosine-type recombinase/integrase n=1 Tax=Streptosporangium canum TaxID=324952 RepID=UPI00378BA595